jgi:hypothetical protein
MSARDLNQIDRQIAEVRQQIKEQKSLIRRFEQQNETADVTQAGVALKVPENELSRLLQRRLAILGQVRRSHATSPDPTVAAAASQVLALARVFRGASICQCVRLCSDSSRGQRVMRMLDGLRKPRLVD